MFERRERNTKRIYNGYCRGGPWDGRMIEHESKIYFVPLRPPPRVSFDSKIVSLHNPLKIGMYEYLLGQWLWRNPR